MMTPKLLREFKEDFEKARAGMATALLNLKAQKDLKRAKDSLQRTRLARLDVGRALLRMHETQSFRDSFKNWASVCRALRCGREESYELMNGAEVHDGLKPEDRDRIPILSIRQLKTLAKAEPDERDAVVHEAAETGSTDPIAELR